MDQKTETSFQNSVAINSKLVTQHLESNMIQLANILRVEKALTMADAIDEMRKFLSKKHIEMIDEGTRKSINSVLKSFETKLKSGKPTDLERDMYKILKYMGI